MYNRLRDIPQFPHANYNVNIGWTFLQQWLNERKEEYKFNKFEMNPAYQRGYVWTEFQKERYIEYRLRGGISGKDIYWNCPGWLYHTENPNPVLELVDGKQRIDAVLGFMNSKVKAFGKHLNEYSDALHFARHDFIFHVNNLETQKEVVEWYLGLNAGGSIHTEEDLKPAYELLKSV